VSDLAADGAIDTVLSSQRSGHFMSPRIVFAPTIPVAEASSMNTAGSAQAAVRRVTA
jgi:hypothetical protein